MKKAKEWQEEINGRMYRCTSKSFIINGKEKELIERHPIFEPEEAERKDEELRNILLRWSAEIHRNRKAKEPQPCR